VTRSLLSIDDGGRRMRCAAVWLTWAGLLAGSVALTVVVFIFPSPDVEADVIRAVQAWPVPGRAFSRAVRAVTTTPFVLAVGAALVVVLWWRGARREAITLAVLFIVLPAAQAGLKFMVDRPRPDDALVRAEISSPSFPAGHVMGPVVVYGSLLVLGVVSVRWGCWWRLIAVAWPAVVLATTGIVNVYLGVHRPTDVLGGYLWGLVLLLPALSLVLRRPDQL
jgi:undecaprenyl-diphosphatase